MGVPLLAVPETRWYCPRCPATAVTKEPGVHTRFHPCGAMGGFTSPMVEVGQDAKVVVNEREDYIAGEDVQLHDGRPIMNITTEYADGRTDVAVYAPTAHVRGTAWQPQG